MGLENLFLLALLTNIDSFYGGLVYKKEWGEIRKIELLTIFVCSMILVSIPALLGRLTFILVGGIISKLISILLLGSTSILFYIIMQKTTDEQAENKAKFKNSRVVKGTLQLEKMQGNRLLTLFKLAIITSVDMAVVSFIVATLTSKVLLIIITFSSIDLFLVKAGNLIYVD